MIGRLLCRIGLHNWWTYNYGENVAPRSGGGPLFIDDECLRCGEKRQIRNYRE